MSKYRRIISGLLSLTVAFGALSLSSPAIYADDTPAQSVSDSSGAAEDESQDIYVTGDYEYRKTADGEHVVITKYNGTEENIIISTSFGGLTVTEIGEGAFAGCESVRQVRFPGCVEYIRDNAFADTPNLEKADLSRGLKAIGNDAFLNSGLSSVNIPDTVISIGNGAFMNTGLVNVSVPGSVKTVGTVGEAGSNGTPVHGVFESCKSLEKINFGSDLEIIGDRTLYGCDKLNSLSFGVISKQKLERIGSQAFEGCSSLDSISFGLPPSLKKTDDRAFADCTGLSSLSFRSKDCDIASTAFEGCELEKIGVLPDSATESCIIQNFPDIPVSYITTDDPVAIESDGLEYRIVTVWNEPGKVSVEAYVSGCPGGTEEIVVPDKVKGNLREYPVVGVYEKAFAGQDKLRSVTLPDTIVTIEPQAFYGTTSLKSIDLPDSVRIIRDGAFAGSGLTEITLPENCRVGSEYDPAFPPQTNIGLPEKKDYMGAFENCKELKSFTGSADMYVLMSRMFSGCEKLTEVKGIDGVTETGYKVFENCKSLEEIEFSDAITTINDGTFDGCTALKKIVIPAEECGIRVYTLSSDVEIWCYEDSGLDRTLRMCGWKNLKYLDASQRTTVPATQPETDPPYYPTGENIRHGDSNCDGRITVADVVAILQYIAAHQKYPLTPEGLLNADVDGVMGITGSDALMVQKMDAGIYSIPVQEKAVSAKLIKVTAGVRHGGWSGFIAYTPEELRELITANEEYPYEVEEVSDEMFNDGAVILIYSPIDSPDRYTIIREMKVSGGRINVATETRAFPELRELATGRKYLFSVPADEVKGVSEFVFDDTSPQLSPEEENSAEKWFNEWLNAQLEE